MLVPDSKGGRIEVAVLGRGQFVGERSVINDKLRSADCVAQGRVQVRVAYSVGPLCHGLCDGHVITHCFASGTAPHSTARC